MTTPSSSDPATATRRWRAVATAVGVVALAAAVALGVRPLLRAAPSSDVAVAPTTTAAASPVPPVEPPAASTPKAGKGKKSAPKPAPADPAPRPRPKRKPPRAKRTPAPQVVQPPVETQLRAFSGLSTWIDIYDTDLTPAQQVDRAAAGGAELIFVQSARHKSPTDIQDPVRLGEVLELAHDNGMLVMVWYVPDFVRERRDYRRSQAAIAFQSPRGDRPDAFGLDIEVEDQADIALRTQRLLGLSAALREWVGPDYPMAAIVLPPLQLELRADWWPNFPYAQLRPFYDAYIPMSYSSYRGTDAATTYRWNVQNVRLVRREAGDPALPIHLAGGIADNFPQVGSFVRAVRDSGALGGGLYDLSTTHPDAWAILRALRAQPTG